MLHIMEKNRNDTTELDKPLIDLPPLNVDVSFEEYEGEKSENQEIAISSLQDHLHSPGLQEILISDVHLLKIIGKGSFGVVYKAGWNGPGKGCIVAVKKVETDTELSAFNNEIRQLSRVTHDNIIQMYGIASTKAAKYLIMEFADGGSLYTLLHCPPYSKYSLAQALSWLQQCARAIAYLHAIQPVPIIHRDLKPLNMLLTCHKRVLKICDFGTACALRSVMSDNRGSTAWMAPEVIKGGKYNEKCDVYSWGMILWEVLTRRIPFEEFGQPFRILWQIVNNVRPPSIQGCPEPIERLMRSCWVAEHSQRPTMQEVLDAICPLCKLMKGAHDFGNYFSSSVDSCAESLMSPLNDGYSGEHTSQDASEFTDSATTDLPLPPPPADSATIDSPEERVPNSSPEEEVVSFGSRISPNVSASVMVKAENLLAPWGSAKSDDTYIPHTSSSTTPKYSPGNSPFLIPSSVSSPSHSPTSIKVSPSSTPKPNIPLTIDIPQDRVVEPGGEPILNTGVKSVKPEISPCTTSSSPNPTLISQVYSPPLPVLYTTSHSERVVQPPIPNPLAYSHSQLIYPVQQLNLYPPLSSALTSVTSILSPSPTLVTTTVSPPLTSVTTTLTLASPTTLTGHDLPRTSCCGVTLRQNASLHQPGSVRRRSAEVPMHSSHVIGHRRSSSYESSDLKRFEPLAFEILRENSHDEESYVSSEMSCTDGERERRNGLASPSRLGRHVQEEGQGSSYLGVFVPTSQSGSPHPLLTHPRTTPSPSQTRINPLLVTRDPIPLAAHNIFPSRAPVGARSPGPRLPCGSTSDRINDSEELGALWELLDEELKPSMPQPSNQRSQQIFQEHKGLAHQLLVVQEEIVFLEQEKKKLLKKLKDQDLHQHDCKNRYNTKILQLKDRNNILRLSHSRLSQQLDEIRSRRRNEAGGNSGPQHQPPTSIQYHGPLPQQRDPEPSGPWSSPPPPHLQHQYYRDQPFSPQSKHN